MRPSMSAMVEPSVLVASAFDHAHIRPEQSSDAPRLLTTLKALWSPLLYGTLSKLTVRGDAYGFHLFLVVKYPQNALLFLTIGNTIGFLTFNTIGFLAPNLLDVHTVGVEV